MNFVQLTTLNGDPLWVNLAHLVTMSSYGENTWLGLSSDPDGRLVSESLDVVHARVLRATHE